MAQAILVLNAGSSSLKFSVFLARGAELELWLRGQAEGLYTVAKVRGEGRGGEGRLRAELEGR